MGKKKTKKGGGGGKSKSKPRMKRLQQTPKQKGIGPGSASAPVTSAPVDNPFEMRVNKRKHDNLGRRGRNELGVPGISRGKAIEKRNKTLLQEYKVRNKSSVLLDNRIGEKRKGMPEEEKIIKRSAAEKARQFKQKSIFNLQETEDLLTHRGQPLVDIDRYEDPRDASDSEDERLNADFVSDANFGGFMRIKKPEEEEPNEQDFHDDGQPKSHKEIIQELILASKQKKYEKAKEADENYELVCKLDEDFKNPDIRDLLFGVAKDKRTPAQNEHVPEPVVREDYDTYVKELQFETKTGRAADRLKTDDEIAQEEKGKLELLERDRLRRMQMTDTDGSLKHRSADDLDDGFYLNDVNKEDAKDEDAEDDEEEEEDSDVYSDVESETELEVSVSKKKKTKRSEVEEEEDEDDNLVSNPPEIQDFSDIPFVLGIPIKYRDFENMLKKYKGHYRSQERHPKLSTAALDVILSRIIKYNIAADRTRLTQLFNYIVRYALEVAEEDHQRRGVGKHIFSVVIPHLHTLLVLNPTGCVDEVEKGELFDDFYPITDLAGFKVLFFDIWSSLFCCTDFNHYVLSPIKVVLSEILSMYTVLSMQCLLKILYIVKIMYRVSRESRRYSPEVMNTIGSILQCFTGNSLRSTGFIIPNMRHVKPMLFIKNKEDSSSCSVPVGNKAWKLLDSKEIVFEPTTKQKLGVLHLTMEITLQFIAVYERLPSSKEIFSPIRKIMCELKNRKDYPEMINKKINEVLEAIDKIKQKKEALAIAVSDKPKPLRLYEPLVEEDFDGMRKKKAPKGKQETARLAHKVKQEMKSAVREIRKDTSFLATQQLREQIEKDSERKRKVKDIMGSLANQEGEYQKSKRGKK